MKIYPKVTLMTQSQFTFAIYRKQIDDLKTSGMLEDVGKNDLYFKCMPNLDYFSKDHH